MAISSDTGSFMYESTSSLTLKKAAVLMEYIDNPISITRNLYQSRSVKQVEIMKHVLNNMNYYFGGEVVIASISRKQLDDIRAEPEDTEGIVSFLNQINGVEAAIFLKEKEDGIIRISVRTKKNLDASELCKKFDGGGHKRAAGCTFIGDIQACESNLIRVLKAMVKEWTEC